MRAAALQLVFVAWASCAGWLLSLFGWLNGPGYLVALAPLVAAWFGVWKATSGDENSAPGACPPRRRRAALAWGIVMLVCLIGGILHPPSNYDALSYRLPRILYWWQENQWHWLHGADGRMNYSGTGFEWQMLPLVILFRTDRLLFALNWLPALLLPFLTFHALRFLGCGPRMASRWMWPPSLAYGVVLQASSIGNDTLGVVLVMAALAFCRLAEQRRSILALILSGIAIAAVTALKGSNLPLVLPLGLAVLLVLWRRPILRRPGVLVLSVIPILFTSFVPTAALNHHFADTWTGDPDNAGGLQITRPIPGFVGNAVNLVTGSLQPPILPLSNQASKVLTAPLDDDASLGGYIRTGFPRFKLMLGGEIPVEEYSGLGLGVTVLLIAHFFLRKAPNSAPMVGTWLVTAGTGVAIAAYMIKLGSENTARIMLPYYPLAIGCLLALTPRREPRSEGVRWMFRWIPALFVLPALLLNPNRPLLPLGSLATLPGIPPGAATRLASIHEGYSSRNEPLAPLRMVLPEECRMLGFAGGPTRSAYSLFQPLGHRKIIEAARENIDSFAWLVASEDGIQERLGIPWQDWLAASPFEIVEQREVVFYTRAGGESWYLLKNREAMEETGH